MGARQVMDIRLAPCLYLNSVDFETQTTHLNTSTQKLHMMCMSAV